MKKIAAILGIVGLSFAPLLALAAGSFTPSSFSFSASPNTQYNFTNGETYIAIYAPDGSFLYQNKAHAAISSGDLFSAFPTSNGGPFGGDTPGQAIQALGQTGTYQVLFFGGADSGGYFCQNNTYTECKNQMFNPSDVGTFNVTANPTAAAPFFTMPTSTAPSLTAQVSGQIGDTGLLEVIGIAAGIPLTLYVIKQLIGLLPGNKINSANKIKDLNDRVYH